MEKGEMRFYHPTPLNENARESGICGESLLKMPEKKLFWPRIEHFRFCLVEELTLDDTMSSSAYICLNTCVKTIST